MVIKKKYLIIFFILLIAFTAFQQQKPQIEAKKNELEKIHDEIKDLENQISSKSAKEKKTYTVFENYNKQNYLLGKIITKMKDDERIIQQNINSSKRKISNLEDEIKKLQQNYSKYVLAVYKYGKQNELASLFDAKSVQQALLRYKYLQKFSEKREADLKQFEENKNELQITKLKLEDEKKQKLILVNEKEKEERSLASKINERKKILNALKHDKASLKKELITKKSAEEQIKNLITNLIEEENRRKKEEAERLAKLEKDNKNNIAESNSIAKSAETSTETKNVNYNFDLDASDFVSFSQLRGNLNWPIRNGKIVGEFGENINSKLNTVTLNYGIDIKATNDKNVKAVADGVVSVIDWIPGYGSVVIVTHKDSYRTVYSHLDEIYVKEGDKVKTGNLIAKVGESLDGDILHFEIWSSRNNQNPEVWLAKR